MSRQNVKCLAQNESKMLFTLETILDEILANNGQINTTQLRERTGLSSRTIDNHLDFAKSKRLITFETRAHNEKVYTVNYSAAKEYMLEGYAWKWPILQRKRWRNSSIDLKIIEDEVRRCQFLIEYEKEISMLMKADPEFEKTASQKDSPPYYAIQKGQNKRVQQS